MPVSMPVGRVINEATMATDTSEPGGQSSIYRNPGASSASMPSSNPRLSMKNASVQS